MSRLTNRSAIQLCTICNTANKAKVKVIETCRKTVFVLSLLFFVSQKMTNYVKTTLASIVGAEQFTGP